MRTEQELGFEYIMSCVVSSQGVEDLRRVNPYLEGAPTVLSHAMNAT